MRKVLIGLGTVALTTSLVLPTSPAAAVETSASCGVDSVRLLTTPILGSADNRIWIDQRGATTLLVCIDIPFANIGSGVIVVDGTAGGTLPSVSHAHDPALCNVTLLNPSDPVSFRLAINAATRTVCFTVEGSTLTLSFDQGSVTGLPEIQIWRDGNGDWLDVAACPLEWVLWQLDAGPNTCFTTPGRIL